MLENKTRISRKGYKRRTKIKNTLMEYKGSEYVLHKQIAEFLTLVLIGGTYFTTVENSNHSGGTLARINQGKDKAKGVKAGFPDILLIHEGQAYTPEIKLPGKHSTKIQKEEQEKIRNAGGKTAEWHSIQEAFTSLKQWNIPVREVTF